MPKITGRVRVGDQENVTTDDERRSQLRATDFPVTDKALGLATGNQYDGKSRQIVSWGDGVPLVAGDEADVDRNPYNFVPLGSDGPWLENAPHPNHEKEQDGQLSGWFEYTMELKTPLFVPEGFPFRSESRLETPRHFCRMHLDSGASSLRYSVPGSSLKGAIRCEVEAITNSLFGLVDRKNHQLHHVYRRRAMKAAGIINKASVDGDWDVQMVNVDYIAEEDWPNGFKISDKFKRVASVTRVNGPAVSKIRLVPENYRLRSANRRWEEFQRELEGSSMLIPYHGGLLDLKDDKKYLHLRLTSQGRSCKLSNELVKTYHNKLLAHPHFKRHFEKYRRKYKDLDGDLSDSGMEAKFEEVLSKLKLKEGDLIFFTYEGNSVTSFGKNINYLWPAKKSVYDLADKYFPKVDGADESQEVRSLNEPLSLAERMFGFSGIHTATSHPFKGRVSIEPAFGREAEDCDSESHWPELTITEPVDSKSLGIRLRLAPLQALSPYSFTLPNHALSISNRERAIDCRRAMTIPTQSCADEKFTGIRMAIPRFPYGRNIYTIPIGIPETLTSNIRHPFVR